MNIVMLNKYMAWWCGGLTDLVPGILDVTARKSLGCIAVNLGKTSNSVTWTNKDTKIDCGIRFNADQALKSYNQYVTSDSNLVSHSCDIRISNEIILKRSISLPISTKDNIENVILYELDRYTPFKKEDVYTDVKLQNINKKEKKISVLLSVIKKSALDEVIKFCQLSNLKINNIYTNTLDDNRDRVELKFVPELTRKNESRSQSLFKNSLYGIVICLSLAALVIPVAKNYYHAYKYEATLDEQSSEIADVKELLSIYKQNTLEAQRSSELYSKHIPVIDILNELTTIIPDDTSLSRLSYSEGRVQMEGISDSASRLIPTLDASVYFSDVEFIAPVTRNSNTGSENFAIEVKLNSLN